MPIRRQSHATLYVDGKPQQTSSIKFPTTDRLTRGFIGTNAVAACPRAVARCPATEGGAQPLCGQVGAVFLFAQAIDAEEARQFWSLGASVDWVLDRGENAAEQAPAAQLLLALNPKSRDGDGFPNNALQQGAGDSASNSAPDRRSAQSARLQAGSHACITHTVRDSAACLSGVQLLFPLLARLPGASSEAAGAKAEQLLVQLLGLVSQMLWESAADQHFMLRQHGFATFVFLLRQLPPMIWTVQAVTACVQLTSCFASTEALHHEAVWLLFGTPRLWIFTQIEVQLAVYEVLQSVIERKPRAFLSSAPGVEPLLCVQTLLDMLEVYYWHQPSAASFARQPLRHAVSGEVIGERPSIEGLRKLRNRVLGLLQVLAEVELTRADAKCLVAVLRSCRDASVLKDVLKMLMSWLAPIDSQGSLGQCGTALMARLTELAQSGDETMYDTLVDLMHGDAELLRLAALRLLGLLLAAAGPALQPAAAIWSRVTHALSGAALSGTTYSALLDTLVGKPQSVTLDPTALPAERVCHAPLLGTVLQLLPSAAFPIQRQALVHLTDLCRADRGNCDALLNLPGWQRCLLRLLLPAASTAAEGDSTRRATLDAESHARLLPMLQRLFQVVHCHALLRRESGWCTLQQSLGYALLVFGRSELVSPPNGATSSPDAPESIAPAELSQLCRSVPRGMLEGVVTSVIEHLPAHCGNSESEAAIWADNVEQLLMTAKRYVFDECNVPSPATQCTSSPSDPSAPELEWGWVHDLSTPLDPSDLALISLCLDLLHLLGIAVSASQPSSEQQLTEQQQVRAAWTVYSEAQLERDRRATPRRERPLGSPSLVDVEVNDTTVILDVCAEMEPRVELEGGLYWLALCFLLRALAAPEMGPTEWAGYIARLDRLLQLLQPATHAQAHRIKKTSNNMRRQRLQALCGRWQAGLLERQCDLILPAGGAVAHAPSQGALLYTLAWLHAMLAGATADESQLQPQLQLQARGSGAAAAARDTRLDAPSTSARRSSLEALVMKLMTLFEPYPFAPQQRVGRVRDLHTSTWRQACTPLLKQVLRAAHDCHSSDADAARASRGGVLQRLRMALEQQKQQSAAELQHGSELWQQRMVVLHEEEMERRDELVRSHAQQERQVARLWLKLQRRLAHPRAPWAPPHGQMEAETSFWRLCKWENALRQRCGLKRIEHGTRHQEASKHRVSVEEESAARQQPALPDTALLLPTGISLAKLVEGSDGEEWDEKAERKAAVRQENEGEAGTSLQPLTPRDNASVVVSVDEGRRPSFEVECELVTPQRNVAGTLQLFSARLVFQPDMAAAEKQAADELTRWEVTHRGERPVDKPPREKEWPLSGLHELHRRRYLLRASALELFFRDSSAVFVNLRKKSARRRLLSRLQYACPRAQVVNLKDSRWVLELASRWQQRQISNFEFLQRLNTLAGRTYNDLNQYPVFPWVLADYTSETLDLADPATFRDLSKPMGAQRAAREEEVRMRFQTLKELNAAAEEGQPPPFHYGSHYSSAAVVLYYMIRLEPFTTMAIRLQGGFFDHADRLFHSFGDTFENARNNSADVKELIPEFFYQPEIMQNVNGVNLGRRQDGVHLGDVVLPRWATSQYDFIAKHRQALESEYVTAHLHEWVALVFGHKQRGPAAEEACNVFFYLTYEGAVDLDAINDPRERAATEAQINNFGNTPSQLLTRALGACRPASEVVANATVCSHPSHAKLLCEKQLSRAPVLALALCHDRVIGVGADRRTSCHRWLVGGLLDSAKGPSLEPLGGERRHTFGVPFVDGLQDQPGSCFAVSADGRHLFSCGYWDRSVKCSHLDGRSIQSLRAHTDVVSCLALTRDGCTLVTGSRDTTLMVWTLTTSRASPVISDKPRHVLHGHDDEVMSVVVSSGE